MLTDNRRMCPAYGAYILWPNGTPVLCYLNLASRCCYDEYGFFVPRQRIFLYNLTADPAAELPARGQTLKTWEYTYEFTVRETAESRLKATHVVEWPIVPVEFWRGNKQQRAVLLARTV